MKRTDLRSLPSCKSFKWGQSSFACDLSWHSHLTCCDRFFRKERQCGHCETGRPFLFTWRSLRSASGCQLEVLGRDSRILTAVCARRDSMTSDARLTGILFAVDYHVEIWGLLGCIPSSPQFLFFELRWISSSKRWCRTPNSRPARC